MADVELGVSDNRRTESALPMSTPPTNNNNIATALTLFNTSQTAHETIQHPNRWANEPPTHTSANGGPI